MFAVVIIVSADRIRVEDYMKQHRKELAAITPAERDRQETVWDARTSMLRDKDITYHVKKLDRKLERKIIREKKQINSIHPGKCVNLRPDKFFFFVAQSKFWPNRKKK